MFILQGCSIRSGRRRRANTAASATSWSPTSAPYRLPATNTGPSAPSQPAMFTGGSVAETMVRHAIGAVAVTTGRVVPRSLSAILAVTNRPAAGVVVEAVQVHRLAPQVWQVQHRWPRQ